MEDFPNFKKQHQITTILHYTQPKPGDENMSSATFVQNVSRALVYLGDTGKLILGPQVFAVTLFPSGGSCSKSISTFRSNPVAGK